MHNLPKEFTAKYHQLLGSAEAEKMCTALTTPSKKAFRLNQLKQRQVSYSLTNPVPNLPAAFYGKVSGQDPEWVSGLVYSQDPAAMFPAFLAQVKPGEKVLDLCAAPGGKSTSLGEQLQGQGLLVANEISSSRAKVLRENLERWGISNALVTNSSPAELVAHFLHFFDKIVVDAPCSGEGMFRKNPDAITYWSEEYVEFCQTRQKEILAESIKMLKPKGQLIYSTCTFAPEENEAIISWLQEEFEMTVLPFPEVTTARIAHGRPEWGNGASELGNCLRFWPQDNIGEGQFVAKLQLPEKNVAVANNQRKKKSENNRLKSSLSKAEIELVEAVMTQFNLPTVLQDWSANVRVSNKHVFLPAVTAVDLNGLKILNNGLELGLLKKNRFEPSHQLAMVLGQVEQTRLIELASWDDYQAYLHGETVRVSGEFKGFILVAYHNLIFSFGKVVGAKPAQTLKNYYPKGLRTLKKELK